MPELTLAWKVAGILYTILTGGVWFWVRRVTARIDTLESRTNEQGENIATLRGDTITKAEVLNLMSEMERRVMDNFKEFRLEFKEDLSEFRSDLREDLRHLRNQRRDD